MTSHQKEEIHEQDGTRSCRSNAKKEKQKNHRKKNSSNWCSSRRRCSCCCFFMFFLYCLLLNVVDTVRILYALQGLGWRRGIPCAAIQHGEGWIQPLGFPSQQRFRNANSSTPKRCTLAKGSSAFFSVQNDSNIF